MPAKLTVAQLRSALKARGLDLSGAKPALVARLEAALQAAADEPVKAEGAGEVVAVLTPAAKVRLVCSRPRVQGLRGSSPKPCVAFCASS